jgi:hypothetical protein
MTAAEPMAPEAMIPEAVAGEAISIKTRAGSARVGIRVSTRAGLRNVSPVTISPVILFLANTCPTKARPMSAGTVHTVPACAAGGRRTICAPAISDPVISEPALHARAISARSSIATRRPAAGRAGD